MKSSRVTIHVMVGFLLAGFTFGHTIVSAAPPVKEDSLAGITQNWDKNLPSGSRFTLLPSFHNEAVRDNNTGLVWEKAPDATNRIWSAATSYCANKTVGGMGGWRLPSVVELKSVQDPSLSAPFVPAVFTGIQSAAYWSATSSAAFPGNSWHVYFHSSLADEEPVTSTNLAWCVRGPMNADQY